MTLYLVKWDDGTFALVSANDDEEFVDTLDQLGDPAGASWQVYEGPLWLEFPRIETGLPQEGDIDPFEVGIGKGSVAETDDGGEFAEAVLSAIHPYVSALRDLAIQEERSITRAELDAALKADEGCALPLSVYGTPDGEEQ
jgi:hypothetical protein